MRPWVTIELVMDGRLSSQRQQKIASFFIMLQHLVLNAIQHICQYVEACLSFHFRHLEKLLGKGSSIESFEILENWYIIALNLLGWIWRLNHRGRNTRDENWLLCNGPTLFGLRCILCHNFWTNYDLDLFCTSKWPSHLQFCERYKGRCRKND